MCEIQRQYSIFIIILITIQKIWSAESAELQSIIKKYQIVIFNNPKVKKIIRTATTHTTRQRSKGWTIVNTKKWNATQAENSWLIFRTHFPLFPLVSGVSTRPSFTYTNTRAPRADDGSLAADWLAMTNFAKASEKNIKCEIERASSGFLWNFDNWETQAIVCRCGRCGARMIDAAPFRCLFSLFFFRWILILISVLCFCTLGSWWTNLAC